MKHINLIDFLSGIFKGKMFLLLPKTQTNKQTNKQTK